MITVVVIKESSFSYPKSLKSQISIMTHMLLRNWSWYWHWYCKLAKGILWSWYLVQSFHYRTVLSVVPAGFSNIGISDLFGGFSDQGTKVLRRPIHSTGFSFGSLANRVFTFAETLRFFLLQFWVISWVLDKRLPTWNHWQKLCLYICLYRQI